MIIYIAGKISGDANYREKFGIKQRTLETEGHIVINPAMMPEGLPPSAYMKISLAMIDVAEMVYFINDYYASPGAMLEWQYCKYANKAVQFE